MTEVFWGIVVVNFLGMLTVWGKAYFDYKARKTKLKPDNPGKYGERIARLEEGMNNVKEDIRDIRRKMK